MNNWYCHCISVLIALTLIGCGDERIIVREAEEPPQAQPVKDAIVVPSLSCPVFAPKPELGGCQDLSYLGLIWSKPKVTGRVKEPHVNEYCSELTQLGFSDWRLPSYMEILQVDDDIAKLAELEVSGKYLAALEEILEWSSANKMFLPKPWDDLTHSVVIICVRDP